MNYHRYYIPNTTVFITQVTNNREPIFVEDRIIEMLVETLDIVNGYHPYNLIGYVILPDHFHIMIQPTGASNFSQIMHSIKPNFTKSYKREKRIAGTHQFWQRRFWDHVIRDDLDFQNRLHYIHFNPIKHGYVPDPSIWKFSSYAEWVERGLYPKDFQWQEPAMTVWGE